MSLKEAVLDIASDLEKLAKSYLDGDVDDPELDVSLRLIAAQLRGACKAAGESFFESLPKSLGKAMTADEMDSEIKKQIERKKRQEQEHATMMERHSASMAWCESGPAHGTLVPVSSVMPTGAKMWIMSGVYVMMGDGKLWYNEEETNRAKMGHLVEESKVLIKD